MNKFLGETEILKDVVSKLDTAAIPYMLTGSFAMSYYAQPRMTRDIDLVVSIKKENIDILESLFKEDYYVSKQAIIEAVSKTSMFNIIHNQSVIKVDFILRKQDEYRLVEFDRKKKVLFSDFEIFIVSKEDLILSKMIWSKSSNSELQYRDIRNLILADFDKEYVNKWIDKLGLEQTWKRLVVNE